MSIIIEQVSAMTAPSTRQQSPSSTVHSHSNSRTSPTSSSPPNIASKELVVTSHSNKPDMPKDRHDYRISTHRRHRDGYYGDGNESDTYKNGRRTSTVKNREVTDQAQHVQDPKLANRNHKESKNSRRHVVECQLDQYAQQRGLPEYTPNSRQLGRTPRSQSVSVRSSRQSSVPRHPQSKKREDVSIALPIRSQPSLNNSNIEPNPIQNSSRSQPRPRSHQEIINVTEPGEFKIGDKVYTVQFAPTSVEINLGEDADSNHNYNSNDNHPLQRQNTASNCSSYYEDRGRRRSGPPSQYLAVHESQLVPQQYSPRNNSRPYDAQNNFHDHKVRPRERTSNLRQIYDQPLPRDNERLQLQRRSSSADYHYRYSGNERTSQLAGRKSSVIAPSDAASQYRKSNSIDSPSASINYNQQQKILLPQLMQLTMEQTQAFRELQQAIQNLAPSVSQRATQGHSDPVTTRDPQDRGVKVNDKSNSDRKLPSPDNQENQGPTDDAFEKAYKVIVKASKIGVPILSGPVLHALFDNVVKGLDESVQSDTKFLQSVVKSAITDGTKLFKPTMQSWFETHLKNREEKKKKKWGLTQQQQQKSSAQSPSSSSRGERKRETDVHQARPHDDSLPYAPQYSSDRDLVRDRHPPVSFSSSTEPTYDGQKRSHDRAPPSKHDSRTYRARSQSEASIPNQYRRYSGPRNPDDYYDNWNENRRDGYQEPSQRRR